MALKLSEYKMDIICAKKCMSNKELSKLSGVPEATITKAKKGTIQPRAFTIGKLAKALGVDVLDIIEEQ